MQIDKKYCICLLHLIHYIHQDFVFRIVHLHAQTTWLFMCERIDNCKTKKMNEKQFKCWLVKHAINRSTSCGDAGSNCLLKINIKDLILVQFWSIKKNKRLIEMNFLTLLTSFKICTKMLVCNAKWFMRIISMVFVKLFDKKNYSELKSYIFHEKLYVRIMHC